MRSGALLTACALALLAACGGSGAPAAGAPIAVPAGDEKQVIVGQDGASGRATLGADELLVVELAARPSTGYTWQVDAIDAAVLAFVRREHASATAPGGADVERLVFRGVAAGTGTISLSYRRPWLRSSAGDPAFRLEVAVAGAYTGAIAPAQALPSLAYVPNLAAGLASRHNACDPGDGSYSRCTRPKDQGATGACWAFATAGVFENLLQLANPAKRYDLSEQYLVSCNDDGFSAEGGGFAAFHLYVDAFVSPPETAAGAVYEADFPWQGRDVPCGSRAHPHHERLTRFTKLGPRVAAVDTIKEAILAHGPVFAAVCADNAMSAWNGAGIFRSSCAEPNHAIVIVGWDDNGGDGYWLVRNSWGADWGDRGYLKIAYGASQIGYDVAWAEYVAPNQPPVAEAGADRTATAGATVALDGSASADADGTIASWAWTQTAGPTVALTGATTARPTFVAPSVSAATALTFSLTVKDGAGASATDTVRVTVSPRAAANAAPVADAGTGQVVAEGATVTLDGSASSDPDGTIARWSWAQASGLAVRLAGATTVRPTFVAPSVSEATTLTFALTVADDLGATSTATVRVVVNPRGAAGAPADPGATASGPATGGTVVGGCSSGGPSGIGAGTLAFLAVIAVRRRALRACAAGGRSSGAQALPEDRRGGEVGARRPSS